MVSNKSWETTLAGVFTVLIAVLGALKALLDGDPTTVPDWAAIIAAITAGIGLWRAKDANKSGLPQ